MQGFEERRWTSADGLSLYARDYGATTGDGKKLPVLCLHGLTRNSKDFEEVAPWLADQGRRVIVPDIRGRGKSAYDPKPANYVPTTYVKDVLQLLDELRIPRAVFLGTSMGGIITMLAGAKKPKAIAAAILNDVGPRVDPRGLARIAGYVGKPVTIETWADAADYVRATNEHAFPHFGPADWDKFARRTFADENGKPVRDYDPAIAQQAKAGRLRAATVIAWMLYLNLAWRRRTLVIRGATSDILARGTAKWMRRLAPKTTLVEIPGIGHAPMLTEPESQAALTAFLARVP